jgi:hypothetical protein
MVIPGFLKAGIRSLLGFKSRLKTSGHELPLSNLVGADLDEVRASLDRTLGTLEQLCQSIIQHQNQQNRK